MNMYSSQRLVIRQFQPNEEEVFCKFFDDPAVSRYLPSLKPEEYSELFVKTFYDYANGAFGRWGVFSTIDGAYIGNCLLRILAEDETSWEIGYSIGAKYWGEGIGTEIALAMVNYALSLDHNAKLTALTHPDNLGSQKVLTKVGFSHHENIDRRGNELFLFRKI